MKLQRCLLACSCVLGVSAWTATLPRSKASASLFRERTLLYSSNDNKEEDASEQARILMERAKKAREEADNMERDLVSSKLSSLESLLDKQTQLSKADEVDIQDRIDRLKNYNKNKNADAKSVDDGAAPKISEEEENEEFISYVAGVMEGANEDEEPRELVKELSPDDEKVLKQVQDIFFDLKDIMNVTMVTNDPEDKEMWNEFNELEGDLNSTLAGNITREELDTIIEVQEAMSGLVEFLGLNTSGWQDIKQEIKDSTIEMNAELAKDPLYLERFEDLAKFIPIKMLESKQRLNETEMEEFVRLVMLPIENVFTLSSINAKKVGGVYLLQGIPKLQNGDEIVECIGKQLAAAGLRDRFQHYYFRDVTGFADLDDVALADELQPGGDETDMGELMDRVANIAKPAILVTSTEVDLSPETPPEARAPWVAFGLISTAAFAVSCYEQDMSLTQQLSVGFSSPICLGILGIQCLHELGHFVIASLNKIEIAYPIALVPSPSTGLLHTNTQIKTPPKNNNALFDFAIMGPILGMAASWTALFVGLQLTSGVKSSQIESLPHLPLEFFQLSTLTSATIETFLGTDVLLSLDSVSDNVAVHPLVIAGHVGILLNALNLLPSLGTTDGGRMLTAVNGRTGFLTEFLPPLMGLFLLVQGFRGWDACNILLLYSFITNFVQHDIEVPCRNDVDPAGGIRAPVFVATTVLALIALSPAF